MLTLQQVRKLNRTYNVIPLVETLPADMLTPVMAYLKLSEKDDYSFLLESVEGGEKLGRYSFIGVKPFFRISGGGDTLTLASDKRTKQITARSEEFLKELFSVYRPAEIAGLPRFTGGGVGYFAYDSIRWFERIPDRHASSDDVPDFFLGMYQTIVAFDHVRQQVSVIVNIMHEPNDKGLEKKYKAAAGNVRQLSGRLLGFAKQRKSAVTSRAKVSSLMTKAQFLKSVEAAKHYIREGDIFQVVLSRRWKIDSKAGAVDVYRRLRRINPSPYMFLLSLGKQAIIGSSPEMLARIEGDRIETRPIAGTRRRGSSDEEDHQLAAELLADEKELAEHAMLLDLGRNDLGRVCEAGSVTVKERMIIEKYSHVIHIVSSVVGKLKPGVTPFDAHFACFPAGTVSGAPKIRAMEIIDELEPLRRGVYAGSVAYVDFWGNLDSCIAIRTVVKSGSAYVVQAGAGIVADSVPIREYEETEAKARGMIQAVIGEG